MGQDSETSFELTTSTYHWLPMDVTSTEFKLKEVKKFSAEFHQSDVKQVTYACGLPTFPGVYQFVRCFSNPL